MARKLKQYRVRANLTQSELAKAVGVSQPNYQRWESGAAQVPKDKLKKLANVLQTSVDALRGTHLPIRSGIYDRSLSADLNYYGEVAFHFCGGGKPILLSISDGAFSRLHQDLQTDDEFFCVDSLANQTVIVRKHAIADVCFTSEAHDHYGFSSETYDNHMEFRMPDARDWEIVEAIACDGIGLDDFSKRDIQRVTEEIGDTDEETHWIFDLATNTTWQLSNGQRRSMHVESAELFAALEHLLEPEIALGEPLIRLPAVDWHYVAFLNQQSIDYIMLPTHQFEQGRVEMEAKLLEPLE